ncbi:RND family efflux transporter MFP subunit [Tahibacter aquaticus]|uniref:RND family efflux transporter MFP subunit n=1 Tax=Tahibacter aquaticus TaxID=520092 RepID=A0A4V6PYB0_9GAMM|nr:efflux RND transporter periplasmic adaptor subunit [Tahibacter aquaticus]TDR40750.1 RND family efflux transporter MFP subunit [Tahibacter aquaticus]
MSTHLLHHRLPWALCLAGLIALGGCKSDPETAKAAAAPADDGGSASLSVELVKPQARALQRRLVASGAIAAQEEMLLGVELSGVRVAEVLVDVGENVRKGQVLLRLDTRTLASDQRQADAAVAEAEAALAVAQRNNQRMGALREKGLISARDADEMWGAATQATARLASAKAQREAVALRLSFAELRAPDDGAISRRDVQPGQVVSSGAELLRLIRQSRLEWRGNLPEAELIRVEEGTSVIVNSPDGSQAQARVRRIATAVDSASRTGVVYASLADPGKLRAGMFAQGELLLGETPALLLPLAAVVQRDGHSYVFRVGEQQRVTRQRVEIGRVDGSQIEIVSGLAADQAVVARGAGFLSEGDRVRIVPAQSGTAAP